ncbi:hypothetical protein B0H14DRAFT_2656317 [Mycena olivaceomarginata]|nr:hypothetical protein B0H14DRAFT_2656317 [Mycena olivaceomarginata]
MYNVQLRVSHRGVFFHRSRRRRPESHVQYRSPGGVRGSLRRASGSSGPMAVRITDVALFLLPYPSTIVKSTEETDKSRHHGAHYEALSRNSRSLEAPSVSGIPSILVWVEEKCVVSLEPRLHREELAKRIQCIEYVSEKDLPTVSPPCVLDHTMDQKGHNQSWQESILTDVIYPLLGPHSGPWLGHGGSELKGVSNGRLLYNQLQLFA